MKFAFLFAFVLFKEFQSTSGLSCYFCGGKGIADYDAAVLDKHKRKGGKSNLTLSSNGEKQVYCEDIKKGKDGKVVDCNKDEVCIALNFDIELDSKVFIQRISKCLSADEVKHKGNASLKIGECVEFDAQDRYKLPGAKISKGNICACDTDLCNGVCRLNVNISLIFVVFCRLLFKF